MFALEAPPMRYGLACGLVLLFGSLMIALALTLALLTGGGAK